MSVLSEWHMRCAECGADSALDISAIVAVRLTPNGTDIDEAEDGDHAWDDESLVQCGHCGWSGDVLTAKVAAHRKDAPTNSVGTSAVAEKVERADAVREGETDAR